MIPLFMSHVQLIQTIVSGCGSMLALKHDLECAKLTTLYFLCYAYSGIRSGLNKNHHHDRCKCI